MHTPGPWKTHAGASGQVHAVFGADGKYVAKVDAYPVRTTDENDANARLIAASPDLYAALQDILLDMAANESNGLTVKSARQWASVQRARAAIAQATT